MLSCAVTQIQHRPQRDKVPLAVSVVTVPEKISEICYAITNFLRIRHDLLGERFALINSCFYLVSHSIYRK